MAFPRSRQTFGRIYILTPGGIGERGGIGRMMSYLVRGWPDSAAPITVVDTYGPGPKLRMPWHFAVAVLRLLLAGLAGRIGLLHIQMSERLSVLRKGLLLHLGKALGIPVALHLHGADFADFVLALPPRRRRWVERMMARADVVIVLGAYWRDFLTREMGLDPARIVVLNNAVPDVAQPGPPPAGDVCRILFLGVVCERKGVPVLLEALADTALQALPWTAVFAGRGETEFYAAEAARLGLAERVQFLGWVDEVGVARELARCDVMVLPSRNEGLPMAILETMAHGRPVVATPVGSIAEAVQDGATGLLVPVGDAGALAAALAQLVRDPELRGAMGTAARRRFLAMFHISAYVRRLEAIFLRIGRHGRAGRLRAVTEIFDHLSVVPDAAARTALLAGLARPDRPTVLSFLNHHAVNILWREPRFRIALRQADLLLRDGVGLAAGLRLLGRAPGINMNGTDLIPEIVANYRGRRVLVCGTVEPFTERAAEKLRAAGLDVVGRLDGFRPLGEYVEAARAARPDLIILGMGMPKQERVARLLAMDSRHPVLVINGGAILDFLANRVRRAPAAVRLLRLEWAWRLGLEPRRLWRRYGLGGGAFLWRILVLRLL